MKKISLLFIVTLFLSSPAFSGDNSEKALGEMRQNLSIAFHQMNEGLTSLKMTKPGNRLYHDETMVSIAPQVGIKVPILVDLSFSINLRYIFKRRLPAGYAYNKP